MNAFFDFFNQHNSSLATATNILLAALIGLSLYGGAQFVIDYMQEVPQSTYGQRIPDSPGSRSQQNFDLSKLNLFGSEEVENTTPMVVDAPKTSLNLELQGVFIAQDPAESTAIVAQKGKTGELKVIGEELSNNATLNAVFGDHILIKRGNRIEKLPFSDNVSIKEFISSPAQAFSNSRPNQSGLSSSRMQSVRDRIAKRSREIARSRSDSSRSNNPDLVQQINAYRERLSTDPRSVLDELGMSAVSDGETNGYRIGSNVSQAMLRQAGLHKDDVILTVNGQPVGDIEKDKALINQFMRAKRVRLEVQRDTRKFFVTVPIPQ